VEQSFRSRLAASAGRVGSWLCVGLDPDPDHYPAGLGAEDTLEFLLGVVEATAGVACAVKPNAAFFEALGRTGHEALAELVESVPPGLPVILDGKRNDIGNTARKYAEAAFDELGADAVTVTPYLGRDTVEPFASYADKGVFLLARTSNPSAGDVQDLAVSRPGGGGSEPLYRAVARKAMEWDREWHNLGLVAGATYPNELAELRQVCGDGVPFLIPGVGAQGADARATLAKGADSSGSFAVVNVGRAILNAGKGDGWRDQVAAAARRFAADLRAVPAAKRS
jgi:orotidine-5'-phosphate decarboxylase